MQKLFENWREHINENSLGIEKYFKIYPLSRNKKIREIHSKIVNVSSKIALNYVKEFYLDNYKSFKRLINSVSNSSNEKDEVTKQNWSVLSSEIEKQLSSTPVKMFYDDIDKFNDYALKNAQALYNRDNKIIYVNSFRIKNFAGKNFKAHMAIALREEYFHRAQHVLETLNTPTHSLVWSKAKKLGLILPHEKTNMPKDAYNYYANNPYEFHAKLLQIKLILKKKHPEFFDSSDQIIPGVLQQFLKKSGEQYNVLKIINPNKLDELNNLFNMLASNKNKMSPAKKQTSFT